MKREAAVLENDAHAETIPERKLSSVNSIPEKTHKTALKAERRRQRLAELETLKDDPEILEFMELIPKIKPQARGECLTRQRPCIFVSCKYHLYLDVNPNTGTIKFNFPDLEPWELPETCALDIADRGGTTLEEIGAFMNLTRERVRQLEAIVLEKIKREDDKRVLLDLDDDLPVFDADWDDGLDEEERTARKDDEEE